MLRSIDERGLIIPLLGMMIFAIMAIIGLAVDGGHLHHYRLTLQKAADAAVIAAAKRYALTPASARSTSFILDVKEDVRDALRANLVANHGAIDTNLEITISDSDVDRTKETVTVDATWNVRLYILGHFPGYSTELPVRVRARSQVRKAMVSMILDTSFSMLCPTATSDCSCLRASPYYCPAPRILQAIAAAKSFAALFNEKRDMIDITWYSLSARTDVPMWEWGQFNPSTIYTYLDLIATGFHLQGASNTCDGLFMSYYGTKLATNTQHRTDVARVLFNDGGAPAGARFFFHDILALEPNNPYGLSYAPYDYYSWANDWLTFNQFAGTDLSTNWLEGVSDLCKSPLEFGWSNGTLPAGRSTSCSMQDIYSPPYPPAAFTSCLSTFGFRMPDYDQAGSAAAGRVYGRTISFADFRKQYYHCAIAMSDFLRRDGSIVYGVTVGLGPTNSSDPYQDVTNEETRKDCFFNRLTNDPLPGGITCGGAEFPEFFHSDYASSTTNHMDQGKYIFGSTATELTSLFTDQLYKRISRKLKTAVLTEAG